MDDGSDYKIIEVNYIREKATERLQDAINFLQRIVYDLELCAEKLEAADDDRQRAQVMNWSINLLVCNILLNLRIDLLATGQAELLSMGKSAAHL